MERGKDRTQEETTESMSVVSKVSKMERKEMFKRIQHILKIAIFVIIFAVLAYFILPVSAPIILAFLTAASLEPLVRWFTKKSSAKRSLIVLFTYTLFITLFAGLGYLFVSKVITQAIYIAERIPYYALVITEQWQKWNDSILAASAELPLPLVNEIRKQIDSALDAVVNPLTNFNYIHIARSLVTKIPLFLISLLVYLIAVFLFMLELPSVSKGFYNMFKEETAKKTRYMIARLSGVSMGFFKAQFLVSLIIFAVSLVGLFILAPKSAILMALIIWFIDFIPIIGSIVIVGPWALIELLQGNTFLGMGLVILAVVLLVIRRTVEPKVMGQYIGLSPLATLISMFLGAKLLGIVGFIAGPLLLIGYYAAKEAGIIKIDFKL